MSEPRRKTVWEGKFISVKATGTWEYVRARGGIAAAVILAIDDGARDPGRAVSRAAGPPLPRTARRPGRRRGAGESVETAAARELEEETGYRADADETLGRFTPRPAWSSEGFTLLRADGLTTVGDGGGVGDEDIIVHRVPLAEIAGLRRGEARRGRGDRRQMLLLLLALERLVPGRRLRLVRHREIRPSTSERQRLA